MAAIGRSSKPATPKSWERKDLFAKSSIAPMAMMTASEGCRSAGIIAELLGRAVKPLAKEESPLRQLIEEEDLPLRAQHDEPLTRRSTETSSSGVADIGISSSCKSYQMTGDLAAH